LTFNCNKGICLTPVHTSDSTGFRNRKTEKKALIAVGAEGNGKGIGRFLVCQWAWFTDNQVVVVKGS
jgi:hypothetical protein